MKGHSRKTVPGSGRQEEASSLGLPCPGDSVRHTGCAGTGLVFQPHALHWEIRAGEKRGQWSWINWETNWGSSGQEQMCLFCELSANSLGLPLIKWYRSQCDGRGMDLRCKKLVSITTPLNKAWNMPSLNWSLKGTYVSKWTWTSSLLNHPPLKANKLLSSGERKKLQGGHFPGIRI